MPIQDKDKWIFRWKNWLRPTRTPGLYELKDGGYLFRRMVTDQTTGKRVESKRVMRDVHDEATAILEMQKVVVSVKSGKVPVSQLQRQRFSEFAASLFQKKVDNNDLKTPATIRRWKDSLPHLLDKTVGEQSGLVVDGLGECFVDMLKEPIGLWRTGMQQLINRRDFAPSTTNGWLRILRVITKEIAYEYELPDPCMRVKDFDESEHETFTEENPNALPPERVREFLELVREHYPQFYAMSFLGITLGLRPSTLRPMRRRGNESDVKWDRCRILARQSQTYEKYGEEEVTQTTKQKKKYGIDVPQELIDLLDWHVKTQLKRPEQRASDLLFPSLTGGFRARSVLDKPFAAVSETMNLGFRFTSKGMRRTFQDMQRLAKIEPIITRSISGHMTERMHEHYSTVQNTEQRNAIAQVIQLFGPRSTQLECAPEAQSTQAVPALPAFSEPKNTQSTQPLCAPNAVSGDAEPTATERTTVCAPQTRENAS